MAIPSLGGSYADSSKTESTTRSKQAPASSTLTMDNFMLLLATELQNQDMNSPMSNSEMMQQLTSMATVQSMNTFSELSSTQYALNLMGKEVRVAGTNKVTGQMEMKKGEIAGVNLSSMKVYLKDDDVAYGLGNIMEVGDVPEPKKDDEDDKDDDDGEGENKPEIPDVTPPTVKPPDTPPDTPPDPDKTNNSNASRAAAYATDPRTGAEKSRASAVNDSDKAKEDSRVAALNSRTDPRTGRTATRVTKPNEEVQRTAGSGSRAVDLDVRTATTSSSNSSFTKTYADTRSLRMEYLAFDKREALERQHEIPEDKRMILAAASSNRNATGPAAVSLGNSGAEQKRS